MENSYIDELLSGLDMGMIAIDHLVDKIENVKLRDLILSQRKHYGDLKEKVTHSYPHVDDEVKRNFMLESMIEMKTMMTDDKKIAKMLTEGSQQAVMKMTHILNKENISDVTFKEYADEFENISQKYILELKDFL